VLELKFVLGLTYSDLKKAKFLERKSRLNPINLLYEMCREWVQLLTREG